MIIRLKKYEIPIPLKMIYHKKYIIFSDTDISMFEEYYIDYSNRHITKRELCLSLIYTKCLYVAGFIQKYDKNFSRGYDLAYNLNKNVMIVYGEESDSFIDDDILYMFCNQTRLIELCSHSLQFVSNSMIEYSADLDTFTINLPHKDDNIILKNTLSIDEMNNILSKYRWSYRITDICDSQENGDDENCQYFYVTLKQKPHITIEWRKRHPNAPIQFNNSIILDKESLIIEILP